jgi:hypothetical protein
MHGTMPSVEKRAMDDELNSIKCSCTDAMYSVEADASVAQKIAVPIKIQYRLSNVTSC